MSKQTADKLASLVKEGKLTHNQKNLLRVQNAYAESVRWNQLFREAGLEWLPDPENTQGYEDLFFEWLVAAYVGAGREERKVRSALRCARLEILKEPLP